MRLRTVARFRLEAGEVREGDEKRGREFKFGDPGVDLRTFGDSCSPITLQVVLVVFLWAQVAALTKCTHV